MRGDARNARQSVLPRMEVNADIGYRQKSRKLTVERELHAVCKISLDTTCCAEYSFETLRSKRQGLGLSRES